MPRPRKSVPSYSHHKAKNLAFVRVPDGSGGRRVIYLGRYDSPESHAEYRRVLATLAGEVPAAPPTPAGSPVVNEVLVGFMKWAATHYRDPDGNPTTEMKELRRSLAPLRRLYGDAPAAEFGPKALAAVRREMVTAGWCRSLVNRRVERVKRVFRWATSEELIPVTVYQALRTLPGLRKGRTEAPEAEPVAPVDPAVVAATLPHLNRHVRAMVELQRHTGMRPGEVCRLRLSEVDCSGDVWVYRPARHKTAHAGKGRVIPIGPKALAALTAFLARGFPESIAPVFSPAREREERFADLRARRKSKVPPSQQNRRKENPARRPSEGYHPHAYAHAIRVACEKAFPPPGVLAKRPGEARKQWWARLTADQRAEVKAWRQAHCWHPNQLRHLFATEIRKGHGLEAVQALLGHSHLKTSEVYAEKSLSLALRVAGEAG